RIMHRALLDCDDPEIASCLRSFYLDSEALLAQVIAEGQQSGVFRRNLDPRVGAWELIRTALGYTLSLPLGVPLYEEPDYLSRAIECLLHCLLKTDISPTPWRGPGQAGSTTTVTPLSANCSTNSSARSRCVVSSGARPEWWACHILWVASVR